MYIAAACEVETLLSLTDASCEHAHTHTQMWPPFPFLSCIVDTKRGPVLALSGTMCARIQTGIVSADWTILSRRCNCWCRGRMLMGDVVCCVFYFVCGLVLGITTALALEGWNPNSDSAGALLGHLSIGARHLMQDPQDPPPAAELVTGGTSSCPCLSFSWDGSLG